MGQISLKKLQKKRKDILEGSIEENIICPFCSTIINSTSNYDQLNNHLQECGNKYYDSNYKINHEIYSVKEDQNLNKLILNEINIYKNNIRKNDKENMDFNIKIDELHKEIRKYKISWEEGAEQININRINIIKESIEQINNINIFKEWKINFIGETNYDAGGIMREWFTTLFKALEDEQLQLFIKSDTDIFSYTINPLLKRNNNNFKYFNLIGKLIAKALIDNITVNICFNKLIYKMILQEKIEINELVFINKPLYNSLENMTNMECSNLGLSYNIEFKDYKNNYHSFDIIKNGINIPVRDMKDFINKRIDFMTSLYEPFIKRIRDTLFGIIPKEVIQSFTSEQLELLINGRPFIDLEDWKQFTEYREPYNLNNKIIIWFWDILSQLSQNELGNLLMFTTGTSRVPLGGFEHLESNRGNISRFTIEAIPYVPNTKNYIKAHTCFNRLDIPYFKNREELKEAILFICNNRILGFGID
jgi:hypothetical protein